MKKRIISMLLIGCIAVALTACGSTNEVAVNDSAPPSASAGSATTATGSADAFETPDVKKNLLSVEVTVPPSWLDDADETLAEAEKLNYKAVKNDDGSVTYKLTKAQHKQLLEQIDQALQKSVDEVISDGEYPSLKSIKFNKNYTKADVVVDYTAWNGTFDVMSLYTVAFIGPMYQIYNGVNPDALHLDISIIDEASNEVKETMVYPDDFAGDEAES